jgi:hypothetical protein
VGVRCASFATSTGCTIGCISIIPLKRVSPSQ